MEKVIILGKDNEIQKDYAKDNNLEVVGIFDDMGTAIGRLSKRDIKEVLPTENYISIYDISEIKILQSTIARYGASLKLI